MNIKSILLEFAYSKQESSFTRAELLAFCTTKADLGNVMSLLNEEFSSAVQSTEPIIYDTDKFKDVVTELADSEFIKNPDENIAEFHEADGRSDPNQPIVIKTQSYRELEELVHADFPINIYLSGETGLGKTTSVFSIAKHLDIPVIRVNLSGATDLDDLIGGIRINSEGTHFDPGPVAIAMELGGILLLDECDAANPKVLIDLHPVLERKGVLLKKARRMIYPKKGFRVIATGNSKGRGDDSGKYIGVTPLNHAFMQRFGAAVEFKPPNEKEIGIILKDAIPGLGSNLRLNLAKWFNHVYESFEAGGCNDYIHVRKILDIGTLCMIFGAVSSGDTGVIKAIRASLALSEAAEVEALVQIYSTIRDPNLSESVNPAVSLSDTSKGPSRTDEQQNTIPF